MADEVSHMKLAVIGAGRLGSALGLRLASKGHHVAFGVREPTSEKYRVLVGLRSVTLARVGDAVSGADMIFLATPWAQTLTALTELGDVTGRVIVDCTNPVLFDAHGLSLAIDASTSASEVIAAAAKGALVFKALNQLGAGALESTERFQPRPLMGVAGADGAAKNRLLGLVSELGFTPLDAGPLSNARLLEAMAMLWMSLAMHTKNPSGMAFAITQAE
jgi:8-hydroxy-5-deazaflavin:NADPH oxidoreductase